MNADRLKLFEQGKAARRAERDFHDNPVYVAPGNVVSSQALLDWHDRCLAWSAGWLEEDAGRDRAVQQLLAVAWW